MFITKDVTTEKGINKKAFYRVIGRETPKGEMVDTIDFIGEFTKEDIQLQIEQINTQKAELEGKLAFFN